MSRSLIRGRRSKYGVRLDAEGKRARTCDGIVFASAKECRRYGELKMLQRAGEIKGLIHQPRFNLHAFNHDTQQLEIIGQYVPDFDYQQLATPRTAASNYGDWVRIVEDVKGGQATKTPLYHWKVKHLRLEYGIEVLET